MKYLLEYNKFDKGMDIAITIPKSINWNDYQKELDTVKDGKFVMNFKVTNFPKKSKVGSKCFLIYNGECKGYMNIVGFSEENFTCTTTGKQFTGKFVQRTGKLHPLKKPLEMKGFRGFKYVNFDDHL